MESASGRSCRRTRRSRSGRRTAWTTRSRRRMVGRSRSACSRSPTVGRWAPCRSTEGVEMRRLIAVLAAAATLLALPSTAAAHTPTAAWSRLYAADSQPLSWSFGGSYAAWLTTPAIAALDTNFADRASNNSRSPVFHYNATGQDGTAWLRVASTSPCNTGHLDWLQCANGGGTFNFNIYVRDLYNPESDYSNWAWYDRTSSCPSGRTCWYLRRTFIHEVQHVTIGIASTVDSIASVQRSHRSRWASAAAVAGPTSPRSTKSTSARRCRLQRRPKSITTPSPSRRPAGPGRRHPSGGPARGGPPGPPGRRGAPAFPPPP